MNLSEKNKILLDLAWNGVSHLTNISYEEKALLMAESSKFLSLQCDTCGKQIRFHFWFQVNPNVLHEREEKGPVCDRRTRDGASDDERTLSYFDFEDLVREKRNE